MLDQQQLTSITNWYVLHRMKPQFLSRIASFIVFGENGTEVLLITKDDAVYAMGLNKFGCLYVFEIRISNVAFICKKLKFFVYIYICSCSGLGHKEEVSEPTEIVELRGQQVTSFAHGVKHVIALTANGEIYRYTYWLLFSAMQGPSNDSVSKCVLSSWGDNNYGQLATLNTFESLKPILVGKHIVSVKAGSNHTLALTNLGQVYRYSIQTRIIFAFSNA